MVVNTKKVTGRRDVHYKTLDDFLNDAQRVTTSEVHAIGNWSPGQIFEHMARSMNGSIDGFDFMMPAPARFLMSLLMKNKFLTKGIPAGFKTSANFIASEATSNEDGLASLQNAVTRQKEESSRVLHPGFGKVTREEWEAFHLRHAEMHMSFIVDGPLK